MSLQVDQSSSRWAEREGASEETPNSLLSTLGHCSATTCLRTAGCFHFHFIPFRSVQKEAQDPSPPESSSNPPQPWLSAALGEGAAPFPHLQVGSEQQANQGREG